MTQDEKIALAKRLRMYAAANVKFISRGLGPMVNDMVAAAQELESPTPDEEFAIPVQDMGDVVGVVTQGMSEIVFPQEQAKAAPVASQAGNVVHPQGKP